MTERIHSGTAEPARRLEVAPRSIEEAVAAVTDATKQRVTSTLDYRGVWILNTTPKGAIRWFSFYALKPATREVYHSFGYWKASQEKDLNSKREVWRKPSDPKADFKTYTLTQLYNKRPTWLVDAHARLDAAVFAAYGWPADLPDDKILEQLLELNRAQADAGA